MRENKALLLIASGGMELSWTYAWAIFLTTSILHQSFPFPEAVGSFALAALLTSFSQGRGWRVIYIVFLQALGFGPLLLRVVRIFNSWSPSFSSLSWLMQSEGTVGGNQEWVIFVLVLSWAFSFWGGGVRLVRRPMDYLTLCSRFDRGLVAFFILFLAKFLFLVRGEIKIEDPVSEFLIFPFLVFSLLAIGLARNQATAPRDFLPGYQGIGVILSFAVVVLLFGAGLVFFFLPYLTFAAEKGYVVLKTVAVPVGSILVKVLRFIFGYANDFSQKLPDQPVAKLPEVTPSGPGPWWLELLGKILAWSLWIFLGLLFLTLIAVSLYFLFQWLLSRTPINQGRHMPRHPILIWAEKLRLFLRSLWTRFVRSIRGYKRAVQFYTALLGWGRRSGLPHSLSETPREYGLRLIHRFPVLRKNIELIIEAFNREVYGGIVLDEKQLTMAHSAWFKLRSPLHWPRRVKTWFLRPQDQEDFFRQ
ncbi:MAG: hypothetical protein A2170_12970 [Deltaproteobacteria bacterium RBG_13_53_10]|nr:MAG: hypothetical protein A2170_12970 [Deltaproteobacteria bacterium RBG_13_53_10]